MVSIPYGKGKEKIKNDIVGAYNVSIPYGKGKVDNAATTKPSQKVSIPYGKGKAIVIYHSIENNHPYQFPMGKVKPEDWALA